jgi:hypothetical protein
MRLFQNHCTTWSLTVEIDILSHHQRTLSRDVPSFSETQFRANLDLVRSFGQVANGICLYSYCLSTVRLSEAVAS